MVGSQRENLPNYPTLNHGHAILPSWGYSLNKGSFLRGAMKEEGFALSPSRILGVVDDADGFQHLPCSYFLYIFTKPITLGQIIWGSCEKFPVTIAVNDQ